MGNWLLERAGEDSTHAGLVRIRIGEMKTTVAVVEGSPTLFAKVAGS